MSAGVGLCAEHLTSEGSFECEPLNRPALFCLMCRRVHEAPRCLRSSAPPHPDGSRSRASLRPSLRRAVTPAARGEKSRDPSLDGLGRDETAATTFWYKTEEGPVAAVDRVRRVVDDYASEHPGMLRAEVSARPGCTLVTVDMVHRAHAPSEAQSSTSEDPDDRWDQEVNQRADSLARVATRRGLTGTLRFRAVDPKSGTGCTMQAVFTGDGVVPKFEDVSPGVSEGVSSASRSEAHARASSVRMPVLRSDVRDAVMLPVPPRSTSTSSDVAPRSFPSSLPNGWTSRARRTSSFTSNPPARRDSDFSSSSQPRASPTPRSKGICRRPRSLSFSPRIPRWPTSCRETKPRAARAWNTPRCCST